MPDAISISPRLIPLRGKDGVPRAYALVDEDDVAAIARFRWNRLPTGYVVRSVANEAGRRTTHYLHRDLLGLERGDPRQADHINHNPLDNRRANLRVATSRENCQNRQPAGHGASGIRGVSWDATHGRWVAHVRIYYQRHTVGYFRSKAAAAAAVSAFRKAHLPFSAADQD